MTHFLKRCQQLETSVDLTKEGLLVWFVVWDTCSYLNTTFSCLFVPAQALCVGRCTLRRRISRRDSETYACRPTDKKIKHSMSSKFRFGFLSGLRTITCSFLGVMCQGWRWALCLHLWSYYYANNILSPTISFLPLFIIIASYFPLFLSKF